MIEPKGDVTINGAGQPELEIEAKPGNGIAFKAPVLKDKAGFATKQRELVIEFELDDKAKAGEVAVPVEVRLVAVNGKDAMPHVLQLTTPVLIP